MAALEKIRNQAGLLIAIIGIALLSFILGDLFYKRSVREQPEITKVNGTKISYLEYHQKVEDAVENTKRQMGTTTLDDATYAQIQEQVWEQMVNKIIMAEQLEAAGIKVTAEELFDMVQGNNVHPEIKSIPLFQNPQTGQFDPNRVIQFLQNLDNDPSGKSRHAWLSFEDYLLQQRENEKYYNAIGKGIYVPDFYAKRLAREKAEQFDLNALFLSYTSISDSSIVVTEKELKAYYEKNREKYKQGTSIDIEYVNFAIAATPSDEEALFAELEDLKEEFKAVKEHEAYVNANSDKNFDGKFYKKGEYPNRFIDSVMFTMSEGAIYGPYKEENTFKLTKLVSKQNLPDSIYISQIVISPKNQEEVSAKKSLADSILRLIQKGEKIENLARYSDYAESVKPQWISIDKLGFAQNLLSTKKGETILETSDASFHIIQVVDRGKEQPKIQLATLVRVIAPSEQTRTMVYRNASSFTASITSANGFDAAVEKFGLVKKASNGLTETSREIRGLGNARQLIREAFSTTEGSLITAKDNNSPIFEIGDNYVVAKLKKYRQKGYTPFEDVKPTIQLAVIKEKKAAQLKAKIEQALKETSDIEAAAAKLGANIKEIRGLNFASFSIPGIGIEPKVTGTAVTLKEGEISKPIDGNTGVYVLKLISKTSVSPENLAHEIEKMNMIRNLQMRVNSEVEKILKDAAAIEDNRLKFQ
ncbi:MAG TPA: SurA N-terminal domain-containing protein [Salinivirgaceae bacterium]|nr:SurA N-terminal domain-containing protein [Salinivirgaceae bacterium]